ncbi:MAG: 30S ribosomal protein S12 methylthiotransferase RimO [Calditrichaeota bacterium]|nr:30S ribosomal protein S12 methylthiotransferase RimO [Calditrichota bacterium]
MAGSNKHNGKPPRIHITTLGCAKNVYDSEILMGQLKARKAELVDSPEEADVVIINTCGFIHLAKQESVDAILEAEQLKKQDPSKKIVVCGCLSQRYARELRRELPAVDAFFGTEDYQNILKFLNFPDDTPPEYLFEQRYLTTRSHYAYLKISEGCNHTCAFCAIPLMRGRHRSRPISQVVAEARMLAERGVKELILVAQDTTFYGVDLYQKPRIVDLLEELEQIEGLVWIRLHYLYPTTVPDELIAFMARSSRVVPYLDMPIQHITDRMLAIMKRGGSSRRIREIFELARQRIPDVTLRTTLIVGHPGETDADFQALKAFVQEMEFDRLGVFTYSHEENTAAYAMEDLPEALKEARYQEIMELQREISFRKNREWIGQTVAVMIDEVDPENRLAFGRTRGDSPEIDNEVILEDIPGDLAGGQIRQVTIVDASEYELYGHVERLNSS